MELLRPCVLCAVLLWFHVASPSVVSPMPEDVELVLAWGESRSASTFEFMATCVATVLKFGHSDPKRSVCCDYAKLHKADVNVMKTHAATLRDTYAFTATMKTAVVMSRTGEDGAPHETPAEFDELPVILEVDRVELERKDLLVLEEYAEAFQLSAEDARTMKDFMELWQVTRICCGSQASRPWRVKLNTGNTTFWHQCDMYDLNHVEAMLLDSAFAKEFANNVFFPDNHYPLWKKGYCQRSVDALKKGLKFNQDYWLSWQERNVHGC